MRARVPQVRLVPRRVPLAAVPPLALAQFSALAFNRRRPLLGATLRRLGTPEPLMAELEQDFGSELSQRCDPPPPVPSILSYPILPSWIDMIPPPSLSLSLSFVSFHSLWPLLLL